MENPQESQEAVGDLGRIDLFLSRKIADAREMNGISAEMLASRLEISADMLKEYEAGARKISATLLFRISQTLCVSLSEIFSDAALTEPSAFKRQ